MFCCFAVCMGQENSYSDIFRTLTSHGRQNHRVWDNWLQNTHAYRELINCSSVNNIPAKARRQSCKLSGQNMGSNNISAKNYSPNSQLYNRFLR